MHFSNFIVVFSVLAGIALWVLVRRNRIWRESCAELFRRRPLALMVFGLYLLIALVDSVVWVGGSASEGDAVFVHQARSVIDRVFSDDFQEKSYSAPLAEVEFYGGADLKHPGKHWMGTDVLGRDVFYLMLKGVKIALLLGGVTTVLAILLALFFGVTAGYFGGWWDDLVFFFMSTLASIPSILLLIALIAVLGEEKIASVCVALGVTSWVGFCRLSRAETLKLRELNYVEAARSLGVSEWQIVLRHIVPNLFHLVVITFALMFSGVVLAETTLAYLGIGVQGSWGQMIDQARDELSRDPVIWWNLLGASTALFILILAVNLIGDTLRDIFDPRTLRDRR